MSYLNIFENALDTFIYDYENSIYEPRTESDIHGYLFSLCILGCIQYGAQRHVHLNHMHPSMDRKKKIDLLIGSEIAVEVKFEADYPGVSKPVVFKEEVNQDLERIAYLKNNGLTMACLVFVDEDGEHYRHSMTRYDVKQSEWKLLKRGSETTYMLVIRK